MHHILIEAKPYLLMQRQFTFLSVFTPTVWFLLAALIPLLAPIAATLDPMNRHWRRLRLSKVASRTTIALWWVFSVLLKQNMDSALIRRLSPRLLWASLGCMELLMLALFDANFYETLMFYEEYDYIDTMEDLARSDLKVLIRTSMKGWFERSPDPIARKIYQRADIIEWSVEQSKTRFMAQSGNTVEFSSEEFFKWIALEDYYNDQWDSRPKIHISPSLGVIAPNFLPISKVTEEVHIATLNQA